MDYKKVLFAFFLSLIFLAAESYSLRLVTGLFVLLVSFLLLPQKYRVLANEHSVLIAVLSIWATILAFALQVEREDVFIKRNLVLENANNAHVFKVIKDNKTNNNYAEVYRDKFLYSYSRQYANYNLKNKTDECLNEYLELMSNFEITNVVIDQTRSLEYDFYTGNKNITNDTLVTLNKKIARYNDWARVNLESLLDNECIDWSIRSEDL